MNRGVVRRLRLRGASRFPALLRRRCVDRRRRLVCGYRTRAQWDATSDCDTRFGGLGEQTEAVTKVRFVERPRRPLHAARRNRPGRSHSRCREVQRNGANSRVVGRLCLVVDPLGLDNVVQEGEGHVHHRSRSGGVGGELVAAFPENEEIPVVDEKVLVALEGQQQRRNTKIAAEERVHDDVARE